MNITTDDDRGLDEWMSDPLLDVPDHFLARVMSALPDRPHGRDSPSRALRAWRVLQAAVIALCGALGAVEVMLFICGAWTATAVGIG